MKREKKAAIISGLHERFSGARVAILTEFGGMRVEEMRELRDLIRAAHGEFRVVKNTLARKASDNTPLEQVKEYFRGPVGVVVGYDDPVLPSKVLKDFIKKKKGIRITVGLVEGQVVGPDGITMVAELPPKQVLLSQLLLQMRSPVVGLSVRWRGVLQRCVFVMKAVMEKKAKES